MLRVSEAISSLRLSPHLHSTHSRFLLSAPASFEHACGAPIAYASIAYVAAITYAACSVSPITQRHDFGYNAHAPELC